MVGKRRNPIGRLCAVEGCGKLSVRREFCSAHHHRFLRHGDPKAGRSHDGDALKYVNDVVLSYDGEPCLPWPYARSDNGYGSIVVNGRRMGAHRYVCIRAHGNPIGKMDAAHSCGKGAMGCVSPRHLSWKTRQGNDQDKRMHGTHISQKTSCRYGHAYQGDNLRITTAGTRKCRTCARLSQRRRDAT